MCTNCYVFLANDDRVDQICEAGKDDDNNQYVSTSTHRACVVTFVRTGPEPGEDEEAALEPAPAGVD